MNKQIFLLAIVLLIIFYPVNGAIDNFTVTKGTTYIKWSWDNTYDDSVSEITIDGITSYYNKTYISNEGQGFILSDLQPNSIHNILVKDKVDAITYSVFNETNTSLIPETKQESTYSFLFDYIWLLLAIVLIAIASLSRSEYVAYLAVLVSIIGFIRGVTDKSFIIYMLYLFMIIVSYFSAESNKGG